MLKKLFELISKQQKGKERAPVFAVGEQLKEICEANPEYCETVLADIDTKGMSISDCEVRIKNRARQNGGFCSYREAEKIIREFYGLPEPEEKPKSQPASKPVLNLADFI